MVKVGKMKTRHASLKNAKGKALRTLPLRGYLHENLIKNNAGHEKVLRLYAACKIYASGIIPIRRDDKQTFRRKQIMRKLAINEKTFYAYIAQLKKLGLTHHDLNGNLCIRGAVKIVGERKVAYEAKHLDSLPKFKNFIRAIQMAFEMHNKKRCGAYRSKTNVHLAQSYALLKNLGLSLPTASLESYMDDAFAAGYFTHTTGVSRSSISKSRKAAHYNGFLQVVNAKLRCELPGNTQDPQALIAEAHRLNELCDFGLNPVLRKDARGYYFTHYLPSLVKARFRVYKVRDAAYLKHKQELRAKFKKEHNLCTKLGIAKDRYPNQPKAVVQNFIQPIQTVWF
jgi:hypothetical protein